MTDWTQEDQDQALAQGWGIFAVDGNPDKLTVQRNDASAVFESDHLAQAFVVAGWISDDPLCTKACDALINQSAKPTKEFLRAQLENDLPQFSGTNEWHVWSKLYPKYLLTDGAKYLADKAGAYWLMDVIASWNKTTPKVRREYFQVWRLTVAENGSAVVVADDGNYNVIATQNIPFVDFPLPEIKLYAAHEDGYMIICLPQER